MGLSRRELLGTGAAAALAGCATATTPARPADALGELDGVGVASRIRAGEITASEALEAAIARAEAVNPTLNFMATKAYEYGRTRAATNPQGPLGGLPTLIKDLTPLAGVRYMNGSRAFANNIARENGPYVDAVLASGVVPFGKSTAPEFGLTATTEPLVTGATKNPWDVTKIAGGSSGGSACAVAAGVVPVAHANDGGGSVRIPASICGLVGLKLSKGRYIDAPDTSPVSIAVEGCVSRTVRDTAAWLAATERTGAQVVYPAIGMVTNANTRRLRIGVAIKDMRGNEPDPDVRTATEAAATLCTRLGHSVREVTIPIDGEAFFQAFVLYWASGAALTARDIAVAHPGVALDTLLEPLTLQLAQHAASAGAGAFERAVAALRATEAQYAALFSDVDVILTPTLAKVTPDLGYIAPTLPFEVGFTRVIDYARYTPLVNASGGCAISLPLQTAGGLPIGAHFMAAKGDEKTLLELSYELEAAAPWAHRKPPVWAGA